MKMGERKETIIISVNDVVTKLTFKSLIRYNLSLWRNDRDRPDVLEVKKSAYARPFDRR